MTLLSDEEAACNISFGVAASLFFVESLEVKLIQYTS